MGSSEIWDKTMSVALEMANQCNTHGMCSKFDCHRVKFAYFNTTIVVFIRNFTAAHVIPN